MPEQADSASVDAQVRFSASTDYMKVGIARYTPPQGNGKPLSVALLAAQLKKAGIQAPLDVPMAEEAIKKLQAGEDVSTLAIARGMSPTEGKDGQLTCLGDEAFPVFPDMVFGSFVPPRSSRQGMRIDGNIVLPDSDTSPRPMIVQPQGNCVLSDEDGQLVAEIYGIIQVVNCELRINPLIKVSEDKLSVRATLYHRDCLGAPITLARIQKLLAAMKVVAPLNEGAVRQALQRGAETRLPVHDVEIARGVIPRNGRDGTLDLLFRTMDIAGTIAEDGTIDYRTRGSLPVVHTEEAVALLYPPTSGEPGRNVYGEPVPAKPGEPVPCSLCPKSIFVDEDGITLRAKVDGVVQYAKGRISVEDVYVVDGDVSMVTGNVDMRRGALLVLGNVLSGFRVRASANVTVQGVVEAAEVYVGGDFLAGGLVLQEQGLVEVEGNFRATHVNEGVIKVHGHMQVAKSIDNAEVNCMGMVVLGQGGRIVGGTVRCRAGLRAGQLGNTLGVLTQIIVDLDSKAMTDVQEDIRTRRAAIRRINKVLGDDTDENILRTVSKENYKAVEKLLVIREDSEQEIGKSKEKLRTLRREYKKRRASVCVQVSGTVYPGTVITFEKKSFIVQEALSQCEFRLASSGRSVEVLPLGTVDFRVGDVMKM